MDRISRWSYFARPRHDVGIVYFVPLPQCTAQAGADLSIGSQLNSSSKPAVRGQFPANAATPAPRPPFARKFGDFSVRPTSRPQFEKAPLLFCGPFRAAGAINSHRIPGSDMAPSDSARAVQAFGWKAAKHVALTQRALSDPPTPDKRMRDQCRACVRSESAQSPEP